MSDFGVVETAILAVISAAVTGVTARQGLIAIDAITNYPMAMVYNPAESASRIEGRQESITTAFNVLLVTNGETVEQMNGHLDAIRDGVFADPTLGGLVRDALVTARSREEFTGGTSTRIGGLLEITTETYR